MERSAGDNNSVPFASRFQNLDELRMGGGVAAAGRGGVSAASHYDALWASVLASGLVASFFASFTLIVVSELGDKTFFIAALMSMRSKFYVVYAGAMSALFTMTVLSAVVGAILPRLIDRIYTRLASIALFVLFGVRMLYEAYYMQAGVSAELEEVELAIEKKETSDTDLESQADTSPRTDVRDMISERVRRRSAVRSRLIAFRSFWTSVCAKLANPVFFQAFTLTFLAEWGDRSQIATIALAAAKNIYGVIIGAVLGHALCTGLAVLGGKMLASRISERNVTIIGGVLFLLFAVAGFVWDI